MFSLDIKSKKWQMMTFLLICASLVMYKYYEHLKQPTFYQDVFPIVNERCESCHRSGGIAPFSFESYSDLSVYAASIKSAITSRRMPPWFADNSVGHFSNDRSLSKDEIDLIVRWIDGGMPEGEKPHAEYEQNHVSFPEWEIGNPDLILTIPARQYIPDRGVIPYQYVVLPFGSDSYKYIERVQIRPGNSSVVHHVIAFIRPPGSTMLANGANVTYEEDKEFLTAYVPGGQPTILSTGQAKLVKPGSDIVLQIHYQPNGHQTSDQTQIGFVFSKNMPAERVVTVYASDRQLVIPPNHPNFESIAWGRLEYDVDLISMMPHMHSRGKDYSYYVQYPNGVTEPLLVITNYDFNWQLTYRLANKKTLPKGSLIKCVAHYDNSSSNHRNPDPSKEVRWGQQTWDEMMLGYFDVAIPFDDSLDNRSIFTPISGPEIVEHFR